MPSPPAIARSRPPGPAESGSGKLELKSFETIGLTFPVCMRRRFEATVPLGNVTLLERPLRSVTLLTVVKSALRARARQYEVEHYVDEVRHAETERSRAFAREEAAHRT